MPVCFTQGSKFQIIFQNPALEDRDKVLLMSCCERPQPRETRKCFRKRPPAWQTEIIRQFFNPTYKTIFLFKKTSIRNTVNASRLTNHFEDEPYQQTSPVDSLVSIKSHKSYGSTTEIYFNKFHESSV